jgi:hypothetical protein
MINKILDKEDSMKGVLNLQKFQVADVTPEDCLSTASCVSGISG